MGNLHKYKQHDRMPIVQGGSFTYNTGWQFYVFRAERPIDRYRLNRRLCGSYRHSGGLVMRFETFRLEDSNRWWSSP